MASLEVARDIMTPDQAAAYLQANRETVYRYIRDGKLVASKLGRSYRIPRPSLEMLLWVTRARNDISLRDYSPEQIAGFEDDDRLRGEAQQIAQRFAEAHGLPKRR